jgi:hypothetical protein
MVLFLKNHDGAWWYQAYKFYICWGTGLSIGWLGLGSIHFGVDPECYKPIHVSVGYRQRWKEPWRKSFGIVSIGNI